MAAILMGRLGDCERDIGQVVVLLASSDSDYITGHTIMVDGGQTVSAQQVMGHGNEASFVASKKTDLNWLDRL